jgi:hypothetical protein
LFFFYLQTLYGYLYCLLILGPFGNVEVPGIAGNSCLSPCHMVGYSYRCILLGCQYTVLEDRLERGEQKVKKDGRLYCISADDRRGWGKGRGRAGRGKGEGREGEGGEKGVGEGGIFVI